MPQPFHNHDSSLRTLHVLRAPLGGLFRHVLDLTREQIARGHKVGLVTDSTTGGVMADRVLDDLAPSLELGLLRLPMRRDPHLSDIPALIRVMAAIRAAKPDVVHGHGSKGALYARLPALLGSGPRDPVRVYTPHGGSLHYARGTFLHNVYMRVEKLLARRSDLILFESTYISERYEASVGAPALSRIALNGLAETEFEPVVPAPDAADFLYVGELRAAKGIDLFLDALAAASTAAGRPLRAVLVGSGPDEDALKARARRLGIAQHIVFPGPLPAREAFSLGQVLVVPSRAESLPYIVLEAAAARVPLIATRVGGVPEIFGPFRDRLVPPNDVKALEIKIVEQLRATRAQREMETLDLASHVHSRFRIEQMVDSILAGYRDALAAKAGAWRPAALARIPVRGSGS